MKRSALALLVGLVAVVLGVPAGAQPLLRPFTFVIPNGDSSRSQWLPALPSEIAGARGAVRVGALGHLEHGDGTPARFVGVSLATTACFPDSASAIAVAMRLQKLGVNLVRFIYFDYHNYGSASVLAAGNRSDTLSPAQMKRLDWFIHQLRSRGIYSHLVLKSRNGPRSEDGVPGFATTYNSGQQLQYFSEPMRAMQRRMIAALMNHRNSYTGQRYADDPAIALMTITDQSSPWYFWMVDYLNERENVLSREHSLMIDSLFSVFLERRYGNTAALRAAYREGIGALGANIVRNPGFESFTDDWELTVSEGAQANLVVVQGTDVAPGAGANALRVVVRASNGAENRVYLQQTAIPVRRDGIYRVRFSAKTDTAAGRTLRLSFFRGTPPYSTLGLDTTVTLSTSWQTYETTFRSFSTDSIASIFRFYIGRSAGDVYLDGIEVQESGREGLAAEETLEARNIGRAKFGVAWRLPRRRAADLGEFYDSLGSSYYRDMTAHLRSLGVRAPIAGTNSASSSVDARAQSAFDFTSESATWDYLSARPGLTYSDSTWVIRQYSVLASRDQKIPEFSRVAIAGKPFIGEGYAHIYPNRNRAEMMLYLPAYASLHDWDGAYLYAYTSIGSEIATRQRAMKDDYYQVGNDPAVAALMPQFSAIMRNRWIAPAKRTVEISYDSLELRDLPLNYAVTHNNSFNTDGALQNVMTMVHGVRIASFNSPRHLTSGDYYFTVPEDDQIASDTREIVRDVTKATMTLNTPFAQGGSGRLGGVATLATDELSVSWIEGAPHATWLWTSLDDTALDSARRSLLTITTRSVNEGALWQFGDSSLGKNWGTGPTQLESVTLGLNFHTDADSLELLPLDSTGTPFGRAIVATRSGDSWRAIVDLGAERTPWFGVRQRFAGDPSSAQDDAAGSTLSAGEIGPMPVTGRSSLRVRSGSASPIEARVVDLLGREALRLPTTTGPAVSLRIDAASLAPGAYLLEVASGGRRMVRRFVVAAR
jgi:hypothetical protein